jgi:competence protein ComEA
MLLACVAVAHGILRPLRYVAAAFGADMPHRHKPVQDRTTDQGKSPESRRGEGRQRPAPNASNGGSRQDVSGAPTWGEGPVNSDRGVRRLDGAGGGGLATRMAARTPGLPNRGGLQGNNKRAPTVDGATSTQDSGEREGGGSTPAAAGQGTRAGPPTGDGGGDPLGEPAPTTGGPTWSQGSVGTGTDTNQAGADGPSQGTGAPPTPAAALRDLAPVSSKLRQVPKDDEPSGPDGAAPTTKRPDKQVLPVVPSARTGPPTASGDASGTVGLTPGNKDGKPGKPGLLQRDRLGPTGDDTSTAPSTPTTQLAPTASPVSDTNRTGVSSTGAAGLVGVAATVGPAATSLLGPTTTPQLVPQAPSTVPELGVDAKLAVDPTSHLTGLPVYQAFRQGALRPDQEASFQVDLDAAINKASTALTTGSDQVVDEKGKATTDEKTTVDTATQNETALRTQGATDIQATRTNEANLSQQAQLTATTNETAATTLRTTSEAQAKLGTQTAVGTRQVQVDQQIATKETTARTDSDRTRNEGERKAADEEKKGQEDQSWWDRAKAAVSSFVEALKARCNEIIASARATADRIMASARAQIQQLRTAVGSWVSEQWAGFQRRVGELQTQLSEKITAIRADLSQRWQTFKADAAARIDAIVTNIQTRATQFMTDARTYISERWEAAKTKWEEIKTSVTSTVTGAWTEVTDTWGNWTDDGPSTEEELFATPDERADFLNRAMRGGGTDEEGVLRALSGTAAENIAVAAAYKRKYGRSLEEALRSELSGVDLAQALDLLGTGNVRPESKIERCLEGWGADEAQIVSIFESASADERTRMLADASLMDRIRNDGGQALVDRLRSFGDTTMMTDEQANAQLTDQLNQRGDGWGTDEDGMYKDIEAWAKAHPGLAKKAADDPSSPVYQAIAAEMDGRDFDKALGLLRGGGTRSVLDVLDSEENRWGTDEAGVYAALTGMTDTQRAALTADEKARIRAALGRELSGGDLQKALDLLEDGKQDNVEKLREQVSGAWTGDRECLDAIIAMTVDERTRFRADTALRSQVRAGVSDDTWARICSLVGNMNDTSAAVNTLASENERFATIIIDAVDHIFDDNEDQVYKAILDAQTAAAKDPPGANMGEVRRIVAASGKLPPIPKWARVWDALNGGRVLTSTDRLVQATEGAGTDDAGLTALIDDLSGADLLENWTNIADFRSRKRALETAKTGGDTQAIELAERLLFQFILDVSPSVLSRIRGDTSGDQQVDTLGKLRQKIRDASTSDPAFMAALSLDGLQVSDLDRERMEYMQSVESMEVNRREGAWYSGTINDTFSSKGRQTDDAHGNYMGDLRSGIQGVQKGQMTEADVVKDVNESQAQFEDRIKAYKEMKSFAASIAAAIIGTIVAIITTVLTGGAAAGFWAAVLAGAAAGAAGAAAAALTKELIQGGNYSMLEEGTVEILLGAAGGAIGGGVSSALSEVKMLANLAETLGDNVTSKMTWAGSTISKSMGTAVSASVPKLPESLLTNLLTEPLKQAALTEGFTRSGAKNITTTLSSNISQAVTKDVLVEGISKGLIQIKGGNIEAINGTATGHGLQKGMEGTLTAAIGVGYDYTVNTATGTAMSEADILTGLIGIVGGGVNAGVSGYVSASDMLRRLNTLDAAGLERFNGIGPVLAARIVADRDANGGYTQLQDILRVKGIGETVQENVYKNKLDQGQGGIYNGRQ